MKLILIFSFICAYIALSSARPQGGRWVFPSSEEVSFSRPSRQNLDNGGVFNIGENPFSFTLPSRPVAPVSSTTAATTSAAVTPAATTPSPQFYECLQRCPTTSEYNPVCGSDSQDYHNNGRLQCAIRCGANVAAVRIGACFPLA